MNICIPETARDEIYYLNDLMERRPTLLPLKQTIFSAFQILKQSYQNGGKLLVCGNGGSASDADHIVGELMKGFRLLRPLPEKERSLFGSYADRLQGALTSISLTQHTALSTAFSNDMDSEMVFAQQVYGYGTSGDVLLAISTSGNSRNVIHAVHIAKAKKMSVLSLTNQDGGELFSLSDICINVPSSMTAEVQELHLPIYHTLCSMLEAYFFIS
ncbi:hypothetical protein C817_01907 [Dorea sp. 5-2]|jgi:D-sedoheptulose 7-phosphate isomerase|nr:hypothetical protein C817_01907 [Dorea sp. 5-2]MCI9025463.1 SIS domain-containing protein [Dorea sp.]